jgi:hypothetical protein
VGDANGRVGDVHVLSAGAARAVGIDPDVLVLDLHVHVFWQLGPDEDGRKRGVPPRSLVERRDANEPVHPGFGRQQAVRILARHRERRALQPRFLAGLVVD